MQTGGYNRLFVTEIAISALFSAAFAGFFTWVLFGFGALVTPDAKHLLTIDFLPQSFMVTLFAYGFPAKSARKRVSKGKLAPLPSRLGWVNGVPLVVQIVLAAVVTTLTLGVLAALVTHAVVAMPLSNATVMAGKIAYGVTLSTAVTSFALVAGLCPRDAT